MSDENAIQDYAKWPSVKPTINLAPRYVRERRATAGTVRKMTFVSVLTFALVVAALIGAYGYSLTVRAKRDDAVTAQQQAQMNVDRLQPIADYYDGLVARQTLVSDAMRMELNNKLILDAVEKAGGTGVSVRGVSIAPKAPCPGPDPFTPKVALGCLDLVVSAESPEALADFVDTLDETAPFSGAFSGAYAVSGDDVSVTVNYDVEALALRFVPEKQRDEVRSTITQTTPAPAAANGVTQ